MQLSLFLTILVSARFAVSTRMTATCKKTVEEGGGTSFFPASVSHGIHSITVDTLKSFAPSVTENNIVPTINPDMKSQKKVLRYSPDSKLKDLTHAFPTTGMKDLDMVFTSMDDRGYMANGKSSAEALIHEVHMREIWDLSLEEYKLVKNKPPTEAFCKCALDVENNGIVEILEVAAEVQHKRVEIRDWASSLTKPPVKRAQRNSSTLIYGNIFTYTWYSLYKDDVAPLGLFEPELHKPTPENLKIIGLEVGDVEIIGPAAWKLLKNGFQPVSAKDVALFLYCALNEHR